MKSRFIALGGLICFPLLAQETDVIPHRQDHLPNKPFSPTEAVAHMTVPDGFSVEVVAAEPDLVNPIAMTFDDRGRIWVTESIEYPRKSAGPGRDRVKILEDTRGDGRADRVQIFADGLNIPTGVAVGYGGVWVLNSPDLLFLKEKDGKEISRQVVLSGFGRTDLHELPSSLTWGPDGWLYGCNGVFNESQIIANGKTNAFTCAMWRVHPRTHEFQIVCEGTSNPYGIAWDNEGSAIVEACHWANDHLFHFVEAATYQRQAGAYQPFSFILGSITDHRHQKTAYCGISFFDSDVYPEKYREKIYVGNIHGGCINVDRLQRNGATYLATAEPDFLNANDAWFMPVAQKVGPDGCLYILDWYDRYHCYQDANRDSEGIDRERGRLYRVRYGNAPRKINFDLSKETDSQLIDHLASANIYFRESAQRLLSERNSTSANTRLQKVIFDPATPRKQRMQALWAVIGTGAIPREFHERLLAHSDPGVRAWAVRAAGDFRNQPKRITEKIAALARDPSPDVQLQVAIAAKKLLGADALPVLVHVLRACGNDQLIPAVAWPNLHPLLEGNAATLVKLLQQNSPSPALILLWPRVIDRLMAAKALDSSSITALVKMSLSPQINRGSESLSAVSARLDELSAESRRKLRTNLEPVVKELLAGSGGTSIYLSAQLLAARLGLDAGGVQSVRQQLLSTTGAEPVRLQALEALIAFRDAGLPDVLANIFSSASTPFLTKVLGALGRSEQTKIADVILAQYHSMAPSLQPLAIELLMQREPWARKVLNAVKDKRLPSAALHANHLRKILESNDREAIWDVEKIWGAIREERNPEREKVVAEMTGYLRSHPGDAHRGQLVFQNFCAQCHTIYGQGGRVGPDITSNGRASFEQLVSNVFDPSLVIGPAYQVTTVVTLDGRNLTGLVQEQDQHRIVLKLPGEGEETIALNNVKYSHVSKLSMMPEGIENLLDRNALSDLFAFLALDQPPDNPRAKPIPGASSSGGTVSNQGLNIEQTPDRLIVSFSKNNSRIQLAEYVTNPAMRPYLHPVRDSSGSVVLTQDKPADHPWQHGIFTGFHGMVSGHEYWMENDGHHRFFRVTNIVQTPDAVSWAAFTELVQPDGNVALEEEDRIKIYAPDDAQKYRIDFSFVLRARGREVVFGKSNVGGLAVRMPWDKENPRQTHLNSEGLRGRAGEGKRAAWCNVERPFGDQIFGIAVFDHPANMGYPSAWRVDDQGLINPAITAQSEWTLPAGQEKTFTYRLLIYAGAASREKLQAEALEFGK
jgi:putative heme-binding domain-containing protein